MRVLVFRNQEIKIDTNKGKARTVIHKAYNDQFSLNDKIIELILPTYDLYAEVEGKEFYINEMEPVWVESVKSHYADSKPWKRYWYSTKVKDKSQMEMFT